jgi:hypothetical protein
VDHAIIREEADREAAVCGAQSPKIGSNELIRRRGHRSTLSRFEIHDGYDWAAYRERVKAGAGDAHASIHWDWHEAANGA